MAHFRKVRESDLDVICGWPLSQRDLQFWAGIHESKLAMRATIETWLKDSCVTAFVLQSDRSIVAYGEIWKEDQEVELARLLVNPACRRQGFGTVLVERLLEEAKRINSNVWLRVHPENHVATKLYAQEGFHVADIELQEKFNQNQPVQYIWMKAE